MITTKKILQFIEGNLKLFGDNFNFLPTHIKEQVAWRAQKCKDDCLITGSCIYCGCSVPGKLYVNKSCNDGERFPDMMDKWDWEEYKIENSIDLSLKSFHFTITGEGSEYFIFTINDEKYKKLQHINLKNASIIHLLNSLGIDDPGEADRILIGPTLDNFKISVRDSETNEIVASIDQDSDSNIFINNAFDDQNQLIYQNKIKGEIFKLELNSDDFDISKVELNFTVCGSKRILTDIFYDGNNLFESKTFLDFESIGEEIYTVKKSLRIR